ncbi:MAG: ComEC/Rec2 family competence protein [Faecousia sp.]
MKKVLSFLCVMLLIGAAGYFIANEYCTSPVSPASPDASLSVLFLDVGQGDAALVGCDGHWLLIDGGGRDSSQKIYSVLKARSISYLDLVIASHPHEDHIGGLSAAFQDADVGTVLCSTASYDSKSFQNLQRYAAEKSSGITVPTAGDRYPLGSATVEILGLNAGPGENAGSIVAKVTFGETSFLFPGDMEADWVDPKWELSATVLKVSHHGSYTGTNRSFIDEVSPRYAVISLGADNPYKMPHASVLDLLKEHCNTVYRTDLQGDITFTSDGHSLCVSTQKEATSRAIFTPGDSEPASNQLTANILPYTYIVNTNSKIFHLPSCLSTDQMKESNKLYSSKSRDELISEGFQPCGNCKP